MQIRIAIRLRNIFMKVAQSSIPFKIKKNLFGKSFP